MPLFEAPHDEMLRRGVASQCAFKEQALLISWPQLPVKSVLYSLEWMTQERESYQESRYTI